VKPPFDEPPDSKRALWRALYGQQTIDPETRALLCDAMREDGLIPGCPGYVGNIPPASQDRDALLGPAGPDAQPQHPAGLLTPTSGGDGAGVI